MEKGLNFFGSKGDSSKNVMVDVFFVELCKIFDGKCSGDVIKGGSKENRSHVFNSNYKPSKYVTDFWITFVR